MPDAKKYDEEMAETFFELDSDTLRAQLKEIESLDLRVCTVEQIAYKIRRLIPAIGGFQVRIPTYEPAMCVYRAVKLGHGEN